VKYFKNLVACLSLALVVQTATAQDAKIGVINALQALFNSDAARIVEEELQQELSIDEARAVELNAGLQELGEKFQQDEAIMTDEEKRRMNASAQDLQVQLQLIQERRQQAVQARNQAFLENNQAALAAAVTEVVAAGGFDLIINADSVPYFAPVLDITARVTAKLNESAQSE